MNEKKSREGIPLGSFLWLCKVHLILILFFLFRRFLLCSTLLLVSHTLRKFRLLKHPFDKITHKVLGIIIRNFWSLKSGLRVAFRIESRKK